MTSFPFILQVQSGGHQLELAYNGQALEFDAPDHGEQKQTSSGCIPCLPSSSSAQGSRSIRTVEILNITIEHEHFIIIAVCVPKAGPDSESVLQKFTFQVKDQAAAAQWRANVLGHVYKDIKPSRHFKVLVNPFGGQGHAKALWENIAEPILKAAGCTYDLTYTTHHLHAKEIAKDLDIRRFDAIVTVSGDGVLHEVINGLMERPDAVVAHKLPLGALPGGSGNALSFSLLGEAHGAHVGNAVLGIIKGRAMPTDLCSMTQGQTRTFTFVLQSFGLIADVDLGTESMRWMGESRFAVAAVGKLLSRTTVPCEIAYIPVETNPRRIMAQYNDSRREPVVWADQTHDEMDAEHPAIVDRYGGINAPLKESDGWVVEKDEFVTVVGGKVPWISKGSVTHPAARSDGLVDLLIFPKVSRMTGIKIMLGTETGDHVKVDEVRYMKVKAYRLTPVLKEGYISVDGEHTPYLPFQVEAHPGLISILSIEGRFARTTKE